MAPGKCEVMGESKMAGLRETRVGVIVRCSKCGLAKAPVGRSVPMMAAYCDDRCGGYLEPPRPGSLWPGESEADFGYAVGSDGTSDDTTSGYVRTEPPSQ